MTFSPPTNSSWRSFNWRTASSRIVFNWLWTSSTLTLSSSSLSCSTTSRIFSIIRSEAKYALISLTDSKLSIRAFMPLSIRSAALNNALARLLRVSISDTLRVSNALYISSRFSVNCNTNSSNSENWPSSSSSWIMTFVRNSSHFSGLPQISR